MAEMLVKTLAAQFVGTPGTTAAGLDVIRNYISGLGIDVSGLRLVDGSGLSDEDRVPARVLAEILARFWGEFEIGPELVSSLPIGGADGTLDERFGGADSRRRVRAQTGPIVGASAPPGTAA